MNIADMMIELYVCESIQLRVDKMVGIRGEEACKEQIAMMKIYINDAADKINKAGKDAIASFAEGDEQRMILMGLKRFAKTTPLNVRDARRLVAAKLLTENKYPY